MSFYSVWCSSSESVCPVTYRWNHHTAASLTVLLILHACRNHTRKPETARAFFTGEHFASHLQIKLLSKKRFELSNARIFCFPLDQRVRWVAYRNLEKPSEGIHELPIDAFFFSVDVHLPIVLLQFESARLF